VWCTSDTGPAARTQHTRGIRRQQTTPTTAEQSIKAQPLQSASIYAYDSKQSCIVYSPLYWMTRLASVAPKCWPVDSHRRWSEAPYLGEHRWSQEWSVPLRCTYNIMLTSFMKSMHSILNKEKQFFSYRVSIIHITYSANDWAVMHIAAQAKMP